MIKINLDRFSKVFESLYQKYSKDIGSVIIWTTIVGWLASSTAQIIGISCNRKYSKEQKSFMIPQEMADAAINIGTFYLVTTPLKKFATKLVKTGKLLPSGLRSKIPNEYEVGNLKTDLSNINDELFSTPFNSFFNFVSTASAVVGGVLSSNIITPILRNKIAAKNQSKVMQRIERYETKKNVNYDTQTVKTGYGYNSTANASSLFNTFKTR